MAAISGMRVGVSRQFSDVERARLADSADPVALAEVDSIRQEPLLGSFLTIVRTLLASAFITFCVVSFGIVNGVIGGTVAILLLPVAFRLPFMATLSDNLQRVTLPYMKRIVSRLGPLLSWLRERDIPGNAVRLNSQDELLELVRRSPGILNKDEFGRLVASLAFDNKTVQDIMTPKSMIRGIKEEEVLGPLVMDELYKTGYSRFPVYKKDIDHVVGMVYLHDLLDLKSGDVPAGKSMHKKVYFIRSDRDLSHALHGFLSTRHHLFVVVNKYRETVGLLSLEDVMEALIGSKIVDEFDNFDDPRAVAEHNPSRNNQPEGKKDI